MKRFKIGDYVFSKLNKNIGIIRGKYYHSYQPGWMIKFSDYINLIPCSEDEIEKASDEQLFMFILER